MFKGLTGDFEKIVHKKGPFVHKKGNSTLEGLLVHKRGP